MNDKTDSVAARPGSLQDSAVTRPGRLRNPLPGVARADRISSRGLERLERHLRSGVRISNPVLVQWIKRYGEPALTLIRANGRLTAELEAMIEKL